jgi:hypothetical protein
MIWQLRPRDHIHGLTAIVALNTSLLRSPIIAFLQLRGSRPQIDREKL